jgi:CubicO group peptidase (beta-lactamase class C family)
MRTRLFALALAALVVGCVSQAPPTKPSVTSPAGPRFAASGPAAEDYGAGQGYPMGNRRTFYTIPYLVGSHSHMDAVFEGRIVRKAGTPSRLLHSSAEPPIRWQFQGLDLTLDDYLARNPATGLIIARGETILVERYQYGRTDRDRFTSWSMAKTVTAMLIGIAIGEGRIRSVDDLAAAYVPALAGSEYGRTSLRHLLQMSSGVRFSERAAPSGTKFSYSSAETQVLGLVLRSVIGRPVAEYLQEKIWEPIGAEADATWLIDKTSQESTYCCINAVLRDYARLGLLLTHEGNWRGRQIIPAAWIKDATTVRVDQSHLRPGVATPFFGYGYQTWIFPGERRMFAFLGVRGQAIYVDPQSRLVLVHTAVRKLSVDPGVREAGALWQSVVRTLGN